MPKYADVVKLLSYEIRYQVDGEDPSSEGAFRSASEIREDVDLLESGNEIDVDMT